MPYWLLILWVFAVAVFYLTVSRHGIARAGRAELDTVLCVKVNNREVARVDGDLLASGDVFDIRVAPRARAELRARWDTDLGHVLELLLRVGDVTRIVVGTPWQVSAAVGPYHVEVIADNDP